MRGVFACTDLRQRFSLFDIPIPCEVLSVILPLDTSPAFLSYLVTFSLNVAARLEGKLELPRPLNLEVSSLGKNNHLPNIPLSLKNHFE